MRLDNLVLNEVKLEEAYKKMSVAQGNCREGIVLEKEVFYKHSDGFPTVRVDKAGKITIKVYNSDRTKEMTLLGGEVIQVKEVVGYQDKEVESALKTVTAWLTPSKSKYVQAEELVRKRYYEEYRKLTRYAAEGLAIPEAKVYKNNELQAGTGYCAGLLYQITYHDKLRSASIRIAFDGMVVPIYSRGLTDQTGEELIKVFENWLEVEKESTGFSLFKWGK